MFLLQLSTLLWKDLHGCDRDGHLVSKSKQQLCHFPRAPLVLLFSNFFFLFMDTSSSSNPPYPSLTEAIPGDGAQLSFFADLQCQPAPCWVPEGCRAQPLPVRHPARHSAGHPVRLWYCQSSQAACYRDNQREHQLTRAYTLLMHWSQFFFLFVFLTDVFILIIVCLLIGISGSKHIHCSMCSCLKIRCHAKLSIIEKLVCFCVHWSEKTCYYVLPHKCKPLNFQVQCFMCVCTSVCVGLFFFHVEW